MRVRRFELRFLAVVIAALWMATFALVAVSYRPGGPVDPVVGGLFAIPTLIACAAVPWPPAARGDRTFPFIGWLGGATVLVLAPSLAGLYRQIESQGSPVLLPSPEAAYPWILSLAGTSGFAAVGLARRFLRPGAGRPSRLVAALSIATVLTLVSAGLLGVTVVANDLAVRDRAATTSRFGPTDSALVPPECNGPLAPGPSATLLGRLDGQIDGGALGGAQIQGIRSGADFRWTAEIGTTAQLGLAGAALIGRNGWRREPGTRWLTTTAGEVAGEALDRTVLDQALRPEQRVAAEDRGLTYVEGARARRCVVAIDGTTFRAAFPQVRWLVGDASLRRWRGELDYWVFADGQLGQLAGWLNGEAGAIRAGAIQATIRVELTATDRDAKVTVGPPA